MFIRVFGAAKFIFVAVPHATKVGALQARKCEKSIGKSGQNARLRWEKRKNQENPEKTGK